MLGHKLVTIEKCPKMTDNKRKNHNQIPLVSKRSEGDYEECWHIIMHRKIAEK